MTNFKTLISAFISCITLAGCATTTNLESTARIESNNESVFVIGASPENYHVIFFAGDIKEGVFHKGYGAAVLSSSADNGYLVGKSAAGKTLAITTVGLKQAKTDMTAQWFVPCGKVKTLAFKVPEGKAIYLADIKYEAKNGQLKTDYLQDFAKARDYIDRTYPALRGKLEMAQVDFVPTTEPCSYKVNIPVVK